MKTGIKVSEAMTKSPKQVSSDVSINECAKIMDKENIGSLLIVENNKLLGIITEKDLVKKGIAQNKDLNKIKAKDLMTKELITLKGHEDLHETMILMKNEEIRRLPIVDENNNIQGLITYRDILKIQPSLYEIIVEKYKMQESREIENSGKWNPFSKIKRFIK